MKEYWKDVASRSFIATWELVLGTKKALIISLISAGIILLSFWGYGTHDNWVDQITSVARGIFATIVVFLMVWAWEFLRTPFLMSELQKTTIGLLEEKLSAISPNIELTFDPLPGIAWTTQRRSGIGPNVVHQQWIKVCAVNSGKKNATGCNALLLEAQHLVEGEFQKIKQINPRHLNWSNRGAAPITLLPSVSQYIDVFCIVTNRLLLQGEQVENYVDDLINAHADLRLHLQVIGDSAKSEVFLFDVRWEQTTNSLTVQGHSISRDPILNNP